MGGRRERGCVGGLSLSCLYVHLSLHFCRYVCLHLSHPPSLPACLPACLSPPYTLLREREKMLETGRTRASMGSNPSPTLPCARELRTSSCLAAAGRDSTRPRQFKPDPPARHPRRARAGGPGGGAVGGLRPQRHRARAGPGRLPRLPPPQGPHCRTPSALRPRMTPGARGPVSVE